MTHLKFLVSVAAAACLAGASAVAGVSAVGRSALWQRLGLQPGRWHSAITMVSADFTPIEGHADLPAEIVAEMKRKIGTTSESDDCLIAVGAAPALVLPGIRIGNSPCRYDDVRVAGGRFAFTATCNSRGFEAGAKAEGRYAPTSMESSLELRIASVDAGARLTVRGSIRSARAGDCQPEPQP
jgi:hypothetical protein